MTLIRLCFTYRHPINAQMDRLKLYTMYLKNYAHGPRFIGGICLLWVVLTIFLTFISPAVGKSCDFSGASEAIIKNIKREVTQIHGNMALTLINAWISNRKHSEMWEKISYFIPHFTGHVISYPG